MTETLQDLNVSPLEVSNETFALKSLLKQSAIDLNVCLPAIVVSYNREQNSVVVQPAIKYILNDNTTESRPQLTMPVKRYGGGGYFISTPLQEGDTGWIHFSDRDISLFLETLKESNPNTRRIHSIEDSYFEPDNMSVSDTSSGFTISTTDNQKQITITESGISIQNSSINLTVTGENVTITGDVSITGNFSVTGTLTTTGAITAGNGASGAFASVDGKTVTVTSGIITSIA